MQRLAEKYVGELAEMAKNSNMMIVPDRPNDLSAVVATALGLHAELSGKGAAAGGKAVAAGGAVAAAPSKAAPAPKVDWATGPS